MPMKALSPCRHPGCRALVRGAARCPKHTTQQWRADAARRGTSRERGIDDKWRALRVAHFARDPWCAECAKSGRQERAAILHHVVEHRGNEALRLDPTNVIGLCRSCHQLEHARRGRPGYVVPPWRRGLGK